MLGFAFAGKTYPIAEPDVLEEIEQRKEQAVKKAQKYLQRYTDEYFQEQVMKDWRRSLPLAKRSRTERIDWVYELEMDIPRVDDKGNVVGILYPKGYRFRPIKHWNFPAPPVIVFDGRDERQVRIVKRILPKYQGAMLVASDGRVFSLMENFQARVYLLHPKLREVARITEGVSVLTWDTQKGHIVKEVYGEDVLKK